MQKWEFWIEVFFLGYFGIINLVYTLLFFIAGRNIFKRSKEIREEDFAPILKSDSLPPILFVVPMHNESANIIPNLSNLLLLSYRYKRVIAVNDGSDDNTLELLIKEFDLVPIPKYYCEELPTKKVRGLYRSRKHPELTVIDKEQGGKFDAINAAVNAVPTPFFVVLDADTFVDSDQFQSLIRPILTAPDTIGVGASIRIMNGCEMDYNRVKTAQFPKHFLPALQALEYLRAFCMRDGLDAMNANFIISGAFSIFPRDLIVRIGGFAPSCGEDVEVVVRLHRFMLEEKIPYKIHYFSDPVAFTLAPVNLKELGEQRIRWHRGLLEAIWHHKRVFMRPLYKLFGIFNLPFWVFAEALEPIVELFGWIYIIVVICLGELNYHFFFMFIAVTWVYTALYTIFALFLEEFSYRKYPTLRSLAMLLFANLVENFGYRQLTLYWRLIGFYRFIRDFKGVKVSFAFIKDLIQKGHAKQNTAPGSRPR